LLIRGAQLLSKDMANLPVSSRDRIESRDESSRLTIPQHTHSKATVNPVTDLLQANNSKEVMEVLLKVLHPANTTVATLSRATRHLRNITLDLLQVSTAHRLQVLQGSMVHHLQVLLPGNTSLLLLTTKRLRDLQHHPALDIFPAKSRT
jgi:hypothetical protein